MMWVVVSVRRLPSAAVTSTVHGDVMVARPSTQVTPRRV
jgi:hypothetical protein